MAYPTVSAPYGFQPINRVDDISAGLLLHVKHNSRAAMIPATHTRICEPLNHIRNVTQHHRRVVAVSDNNIAIGFCCVDLIIRRDGVRLLRPIKRTFSTSDICPDNRHTQIFKSHAIGRQTRKIGLNANGWANAALDGDATNAADL